MIEKHVLPAKIQIRYADLDALGHVNNANYLSYFEIARVHYFDELLGKDWDWQAYGFILASTSVEFLKPLLLKDDASVEICTEEIGTKSFVLSYTIKANDEVYCTGLSTLVGFNSATNETIPLSDVMKKALLQIKK